MGIGDDIKCVPRVRVLRDTYMAVSKIIHTMDNTANNSKIIYFVRHGQSTGNIDHSSSILDAPLTELGKSQASFVELDVDLVVCSPMRRALETLHYSMIKGKKFLINYDCREKVCGPSDRIILEPEYVERDEEFSLRMINFANFLLNAEFNKIAVVCHGCVIASLTGTYLNNADVIIANLDTIKMVANGRILPILCCGSSW